MQLMPSTFAAIRSARPEFRSIDDPEWNIAAGIMHDRGMWNLWPAGVADAERVRFMFGAYNAGEGPIRRANAAAAAQHLAPNTWASIEAVAPTVTRWRYQETLGYVRRITDTFERLTTP
jgi:membrane-bound lytic murein transglycosylase F